MIIYKYGNYISSDKERLEEKISEDIACHVKSIARVEAMTETACEDIEQFNCSCKGIFDMMKSGYIFIEYTRELG